MRRLYSMIPALVTGILLVTGALSSCGKEGMPDSGREDPSGVAGSQTEIPVTEISTLKVMSFNILRGDLQGPDHLWAKRREACLEMIATDAPMLFGLQECTWTQRRHILESNALLDAVGIAVNGEKKDYTNVSSNPIFWRKDILELVEWGTFWLSDTPDAVGSYTWFKNKPRTCTWARFKVRCSGKFFYYFNAHIENDGGEGDAEKKEDCKLRSIDLIIERMKAQNPSGAIPMLFGGDMNSLKNKACLSAMHYYMEHAPTSCPSTDEGRTLNSFSPLGGKAIDHLFYSKKHIRGLRFWVDRNPYKNVTYISDHYPIFCELEFN